VVAVAYLVECAHHVSRLIVQRSGADDVHLIGFPGCYPNKYSLEMMQRLCTHPNVGAVLLVSLGCEGFNREQLRRTIAASGRPVDLLVIQQSGGTTRTLNAGLDIVKKMRAELAQQIAVPMRLDELVVGTVCGGSTAPAASPPTRRLVAVSTGSSKPMPPAFSRRPVNSSAANASWPRAPSRPRSGRKSKRASRKPPTTIASWATAALRRATPRVG
jgi:hypothetical protein